MVGSVGSFFVGRFGSCISQILLKVIFSSHNFRGKKKVIEKINIILNNKL